MNAHAMSLPRETARQRADSAVGMIVAIGSWAMLFGTLFLTFLIVRHRQPAWPPEGVVLPSFPVALLATLALLASSFVLHGALRRCRRDAQGAAALWGLGLGLGLVFAALQTWLWLDLMLVGIRPSHGIYESLFFGLTLFHALHVAAGLVALLAVLPGLARGRFGSQRHAAVANVALFWHFVDVVWVVLFLFLFLV